MTWQRFVADYGEIVTLAAFFSAIGFIALYSFVAPWYKSTLGRSIVALDTAVALTVFPSVLHFLFGVTSLQSEAFAFFTLAAFSAIPIIIIWRGWLLWQLQTGSAHGKPGPLAEEDERLSGAPSGGLN